MKKIRLLIPTLLTTTIGGCVLPLIGCGNTDYKMSDLTKDIIEEMIGNEQKDIEGICAIPRPSHNCGPIALYLSDRVSNIMGADPKNLHKDSFNNVYCDISPTEGCENWNWIILQGHIDMVVAGLTEEESLTQGIKPVIKDNLMYAQDHKTSLGADNGIGVAMILEVIKQRHNFRHGPIRCIFTADEEVGLIGAHNIDKCEGQDDVMYVDEKKTKFIPYLLNVDAENEKEIYRSCSGYFIDRYFKTYSNILKAPSFENPIDLKLDGLKGGHSGLDIVLYRANADRIIFEFMNYLSDNNVGFEIVSYDHIKNVEGHDEDIKWETNQLIENGHIQFFCEKNTTEIQNYWNIFIKTLPSRYSGEDINSWTTNITSFVSQQNQPFISKDDSTNLAKLIGSNLNNADTPDKPDISEGMPYGVLAWQDNENKNPFASANIGPIKIEKSNTSNELDFEIRNLVRSSVYGVEEQNPPEWSVGWIEPKYKDVANSLIGADFEHESNYQPWQFKKEVGNPLVDFLIQTYTDMGIKYEIVDSQGVVEPAEWITKNPNLICSCIGAKIDDAHTTDETLHLDTVDAVYQTVQKVLAWMEVK